MFKILFLVDAAAQLNPSSISSSFTALVPVSQKSDFSKLLSQAIDREFLWRKKCDGQNIMHYNRHCHGGNVVTSIWQLWLLDWWNNSTYRKLLTLVQGWITDYSVWGICQGLMLRLGTSQYKTRHCNFFLLVPPQASQSFHFSYPTETSGFLQQLIICFPTTLKHLFCKMYNVITLTSDWKVCGRSRHLLCLVMLFQLIGIT